MSFISRLCCHEGFHYQLCVHQHTDYNRLCTCVGKTSMRTVYFDQMHVCCSLVPRPSSLTGIVSHKEKGKHCMGGKEEEEEENIREKKAW